MERFETIEKIPTWALCYIINGDPTGLSDEDIKMETHHSRTILPLDYLPRLRIAR